VVERSPEKAGVGGSTPSLATIFSITLEASLLVTWSQIGHNCSVTFGHNSIHRTAESFDHLLLAFRYELLVDVKRRART
jgi:hypothetical protein